MVRSHRASLGAMPEVRTCGAFGDEAPNLAWNQPSDLWQALLLHHHGSFTFNGHTMTIEPFDLLIVPPGSRCEIERTGRDTFVYDFIGFMPQASDRDIVSLPLKTSLGEAGNFWDLEFRRTLNRLQFSRTSAHVIAWSLLWAVAQPEHVVSRSVYVEQAEKLINEQIDRRLLVSDVCHELQISQSQLTRLFMAEHGRTPLQFIKDCRARQAHKLLTRSTTPIKQVAAACGIPNIHAFNRFVRERYGESPRALRKSRGIVDVFRVDNIKKGRGEE
ncbi:MAG: helix-turn-helix transcriptional regulator [Armatimonadetes bacterium]|nr:helix-turn-helix transcriptional regulator [Armatimonadota bacterium]